MTFMKCGLLVLLLLLSFLGVECTQLQSAAGARVFGGSGATAWSRTRTWLDSHFRTAAASPVAATTSDATSAVPLAQQFQNLAQFPPQQETFATVAPPPAPPTPQAAGGVNAQVQARSQAGGPGLVDAPTLSQPPGSPQNRQPATTLTGAPSWRPLYPGYTPEQFYAAVQAQQALQGQGLGQERSGSRVAPLAPSTDPRFEPLSRGMGPTTYSNNPTGRPVPSPAAGGSGENEARGPGAYAGGGISSRVQRDSYLPSDISVPTPTFVPMPNLRAGIPKVPLEQIRIPPFEVPAGPTPAVPLPITDGHWNSPAFPPITPQLYQQQQTQWQMHQPQHNMWQQSQMLQQQHEELEKLQQQHQTLQKQQLVLQHIMQELLKTPNSLPSSQSQGSSAAAPPSPLGASSAPSGSPAGPPEPEGQLADLLASMDLNPQSPSSSAHAEATASTTRSSGATRSSSPSSSSSSPSSMSLSSSSAPPAPVGGSPSGVDADETPAKDKDALDWMPPEEPDIAKLPGLLAASSAAASAQQLAKANSRAQTSASTASTTTSSSSRATSAPRRTSSGSFDEDSELLANPSAILQAVDAGPNEPPIPASV